MGPARHTGRRMASELFSIARTSDSFFLKGGRAGLQTAVPHA